MAYADGVMATGLTGASPFAGITSLDLRPLVHTIDEIPAELSERAATDLGLKNPAHLRGLDRFFYHPRSVYVAGAGGTADIIGGGAAYESGNWLLGVPVVAVGTGLVGTWGWFKHRTKGYAKMEELRNQALLVSNPGIEISLESRADARPLQQEFRLNDGDRNIWISQRHRIRGGERVHGDLEFAAYHYETKHTDSKGRTSYSTQTVPYVFVPMPPDLRARGLQPFRLARRGLLSRGDMSLSGPFDRELAVHLWHETDAARLFVTRVLAPDVQELLLRYCGQQEIDLRFTAQGVLVIAPAFKNVLTEKGHHDAREGSAFVQTLFRSLHLVHEMFEQVDPAYKLERAEQNAILQQAGLEPV